MTADNMRMFAELHPGSCLRAGSDRGTREITTDPTLQTHEMKRISRVGRHDQGEAQAGRF
jgi:hypothetical protein